MAYEKELLQKQIRAWARRETARHGETRDARPAIRSLQSEDEHPLDGNLRFYDQSNDTVAGVDD